MAELAARCPSTVRVEVVPGAGHHAMLDRPGELHDVLASALAAPGR